jgi:hypothetical protein
MSNIINADNGGVSGTPGLKYTADASGIIQFQNNGTNSLLVDASQYVSATVNGLGKGIVPTEQFYRLNTALAGANVNTVQNVLGVGVMLVGSTVYQFEGLYAMSKSTGTTSASIGLSFGGTSTINNIAYVNAYEFDNTSFLNANANTQTVFVQTETNTTSSPVSNTAAMFYRCTIKGTVSVNAGGTFIPQYTLSAAPGGAYTTNVGSYFKISPLGPSGTNTSIGTWS